jgi:hypothetical protein
MSESSTERVYADGKMYVGKIVYSSEHGVVSDNMEEEQLAVYKFATTPARIKYEGSFTVNMGNFQSAKINIGVELPAYMEQLPAAYVTAKQFVEERLSREVAELRSARDKTHRED